MSSMLHALPASDWPRTRLRWHGPEVLTTAELLSVVLGSGVKGTSSLEAATTVLQAVGGSLRTLATRPSGTFRHSRGIGEARAATIQAVCELGRRYASETRGAGRPLTTARSIYDAYAVRLADLPVEEFHVGILNTQHHLEHDVLVSRGLLNASLVHPREVFRGAIAENAGAVVLVHNHPSGDPTPSPDDRRVTSQMVRAGKLIGIEVLDHVIIGRSRFVSFAEDGILV